MLPPDTEFGIQHTDRGLGWATRECPEPFKSLREYRRTLENEGSAGATAISETNPAIPQGVPHASNAHHAPQGVKVVRGPIVVSDQSGHVGEFTESREKMANPKPDTSGLKPFEPGQSGNPGGKTSEQRRLEIENAERATRLHSRMLSGLEAELEQAESDGDKEAVKMITANILKLLKDAQDRGLGSPEQLIDHRSRDQSMTPQAITRTVIDPKANDDT